MKFIFAALIFFAIAAPAMAQEKDVKIMLMLTRVMPGNMPDKRDQLMLNDINECWELAQGFVDRGVTKKMKEEGVIAVAGACVTDKEANEDDI